jgi:predicted XRE-type DNA-binding protein
VIHIKVQVVKFAYNVIGELLMKKRSNTITPEMVMKIKALLDEGRLFQHQIAAMLGVNQGRVSEVKNGHYG